MPGEHRKRTMRVETLTRLSSARINLTSLWGEGGGTLRKDSQESNQKWLEVGTLSFASLWLEPQMPELDHFNCLRLSDPSCSELEGSPLPLNPPEFAPIKPHSGILERIGVESAVHTFFSVYLTSALSECSENKR